MYLLKQTHNIAINVSGLDYRAHDFCWTLRVTLLAAILEITQPTILGADHFLWRLNVNLDRTLTATICAYLFEVYVQKVNPRVCFCSVYVRLNVACIFMGD